MSKKQRRRQSETTFDFVIEAIGDAREVVLENAPNREDLIRFLAQPGKPVARMGNGDDRPTYMAADKLLAEGFEVGTRGRLVFKPQPRPAGAPQKIVDEDVAKAIRKFKGKPTQKAVASELNVAERTLERWRSRQGLKSWREAVERYA